MTYWFQIARLSPLLGLMVLIIHSDDDFSVRDTEGDEEWIEIVEHRQTRQQIWAQKNHLINARAQNLKILCIALLLE